MNLVYEKTHKKNPKRLLIRGFMAEKGELVSNLLPDRTLFSALLYRVLDD